MESLANESEFEKRTRIPRLGERLSGSYRIGPGNRNLRKRNNFFFLNPQHKDKS